MDFELWIAVLVRIRREDDVVCKIIIRDVINMLSTCMALAVHRNDDVLWRNICLQFDDFEHLKILKETREIGWCDAYKLRTSGIHKESKLAIGFHEHPDYWAHIYVLGNGGCSIGFSSDGNDNDDDIMKYPILRYKYGDETKPMGTKEVIDVHAEYGLFLLVCHDGSILELSFAEVQRSVISIPTLVEFPELQRPRERIILARSLLLGRVVVSNTNRVFVWSVIEHPITMKVIYTTPLHVQILESEIAKRRGEIFNVEDVDVDDEHLVRIHFRIGVGRDRLNGSVIYENNYFDVPSEQLMEFIMLHCFSVEEIEIITAQIEQANNA
jgi:hypothetical protein